MKVCIAEKPSVAREIAFIIGAKSRKDGYFEGNGYMVTWTFGHLCTLKTPDDYQPSWKKWSLTTLPLQPEKFETKLIGNKGVKKQFSTIKKILKNATVVINCGDAGQEGELIQRWVLNQAKYKGKVLRLWISSLTPEAIRDGFKNLRNASNYDNLYYAGFSRAIGDWLLGMNATRLYTLKYGGYKQVLSIGRVQTPTLAMLVERHKEIINFVPKPFWELQTQYREVQFSCQHGRFLKKEIGEDWLKQVENKPFEILDFSKKKGKETPPRLFDLTSLQVHCNKRFGYSAENTLKFVQSLYEKKVVTYPRVDTTYLPNDVYPKIAGILGKLTNYSQFTQPLLGQTIRKSGKVFNDKKVTDHHAIIPTGIEKNLPITEQNVYDAITRRFIAAFYPDCIVANTVVIGGVLKEADFKKSEKEDPKDKYPNHITFKTTGKEILEQGWRVLFPKPKKKKGNPENQESDAKKKQEERILPAFKAGESGPHIPNLVQKETQPPKYYTEATLLRAMETAGKQVEEEELRELMKANGIGRPSTRANIIETLFRRNYTQRKKKLIIPTSTGVQLIDLIKNDLLKSAALTGQWEKQLRDIEKGEFSAQQFIASMRNMVTNLVREVSVERVTQRLGKVEPAATNNFTKKRKPAKKKGEVTDQNCPKCKNGNLLKGKSAYGCSNWKTGCNFRLPFAFKEKIIPNLQLLRLLEYGSTIQLRGFVENGRKVNGNLAFNEQFELYLKPKTNRKVVPFKKADRKKAKATTAKKGKVPDKITCPKCGTGAILKGKTAYGCSNWKTGCDFRYTFEDIKKKANGRALTKELVWEILNQK
jgi:DNA topoisomerase-3